MGSTQASPLPPMILEKIAGPEVYHHDADKQSKTQPLLQGHTNQEDLRLIKGLTLVLTADGLQGRPACCCQHCSQEVGQNLD